MSEEHDDMAEIVDALAMNSGRTQYFVQVMIHDIMNDEYDEETLKQLIDQMEHLEYLARRADQLACEDENMPLHNFNDADSE